MKDIEGGKERGKIKRGRTKSEKIQRGKLERVRQRVKR